MTTQQIAEQLVTLCKKGEFETAQKELFAENAVSIEPFVTPDFEKETKGIAAIIEKGHKFESMVQEMHSLQVSEPLVAANSFSIILSMDITMKGKDRMQMAELCVYQLKDGKIVSEMFLM